MRNIELAEEFVRYGRRGRSANMKIKYGKLYSYDSCICVRTDNGFILSNRAKFLGGVGYSTTTTIHIGKIYNVLNEKNCDYMLVDGWAEKGKKEFFAPDLPTHKTFWGLCKCLKSNTWRNHFWVGKWWQDTGTKTLEYEFDDGILYDDSGNMLAAREVISNFAYKRKEEGKVGVIIEWRKKCNKNCDICPVKFQCLTNKDYYGLFFVLIKGTKEFEYLKKRLTPHIVVDGYENEIIGECR